jgi:hypothetical protein
VKPKRSRAPGFCSAGIWSEGGSSRPSAHDPADFHRLADLCDGASLPSRELDERIALAVSPSLRLLASLEPGVWTHPDGSRVRAPRYSSSTKDALALIPDGHRIACNPRAAGRIEIYRPDGTGEVGWGRNRHFPLAASAAALRARASLEDACAAASGASGQAIQTSARPIVATERSQQTG